MEALIEVVVGEMEWSGGRGQGVGATDQVYAAKNIDGDLGGLRFGLPTAGDWRTSRTCILWRAMGRCLGGGYSYCI